MNKPVLEVFIHELLLSFQTSVCYNVRYVGCTFCNYCKNLIKNINFTKLILNTLNLHFLLAT